MGTHCTWAVVFVCGQWAGRSFPFVSGCLRTSAVGGCTRADDGGCGGYRACACARARSGAGCRCGRGRVPVVWLPRHPRRRGPCIRCEWKKGEGDIRTHLQTVTMASIVTVWMTWHVAMSSPAHSTCVRGCCKHSRDESSLWNGNSVYGFLLTWLNSPYIHFLVLFT